MNLTYNCLGKDKVGWSCLAAAIHMAHELKLYEPFSGVHSAGCVEPAWSRAHAVTAWGFLSGKRNYQSLLKFVCIISHLVTDWRQV